MHSQQTRLPLMSRIFPGLLLLIAVTALPQAALAAEAANGEKLAKRWCAACHVVASDQKSGNTQVAPFSAIAKVPGFDAAKLALYLLTPHPKMPDMNLTRSEGAEDSAPSVEWRKQHGLLRVGHEPVGAECPDPYCLVLDLGRGDRSVPFLYRSRHLPAIFRQAQGVCG